MSRSSRLLAASIPCVVFVTAAPVQRAAACSVCLAGDPIYSSTGTSGQGAGEVSVYLEGKAWKKTSGVLPGEQVDGAEPARERNQSQRLDLYLSWTPLDRLTLTVDLPWAFNQITEI